MKKGELVYGVGINDADCSVYRTEKVNGKRKVVWYCPFYKMWSNMMRRAYDPKYKEKYPTYSDVCVLLSIGIDSQISRCGVHIRVRSTANN